MTTTVSTSVKPATEAPADDRTLTYPLLHGGFLVEECPEWCVTDHTSDLLTGLGYAEDLAHEGEQISLALTSSTGGRDEILAASIRQYPYSTDNDGSELPHIALMAVVANGEDAGYLTPAQLDAECHRVFKHYVALRRLSEQVAEARVTDHRDACRDWRSISQDDIATMPIYYLMDVFGAKVVEGDDDEFTLAFGYLHGEPGAVTIRLYRGLTQLLRDQEVRQLLGRLAAKAQR